MATSTAENTPQNPYASFVVRASAGTGKTYQLSQRYLRLAIAGADPAEILTVTFTRKAAAEMKERIFQDATRLLADPAAAAAVEAEVQAFYDSACRRHSHLRAPRRAREAAEAILRRSQSLKIQNFDSLFHELVQRFPVEAGADLPIPLTIASTLEMNEIKEQAFLRLFAEAEGPDPDLHALLRRYLEQPDATTRKLKEDLQELHEEQLFMWELQQRNGGGHSLFMLLPPPALQGRSEAEVRQMLAQMLEKIRPGVGGTKGAALEEALQHFSRTGDLSTFESVLFKKKPPWELYKTIADRLDAEEQRWLMLLVYELLRVRQNAEAETLFAISERFERYVSEAKRQSRLVEYDDVTRAAYRLFLSDESFGARYYLFLRVSHLLVDEFQDTNRVQWDIFSTMAEELLAGEGLAAEKGMLPTVFIVGDAKQSIYGFRQGDYRLLDTAARQLESQFGVQGVSMDRSWRASNFLLEQVNAVFGHPAYSSYLPDFQRHSTAIVEGKPAIPDFGAVTLLEPVKPTGEAEDSPDEREAMQIVSLLREWKKQGLPVYDRRSGRLRPLQFGDVGILYRQKKRVQPLEQAFIREGVPYLREERSGYFLRREIEDLLAFLDFLANCGNDVALATLLRSPLLRMSDARFMALLGMRLAENAPRSLFELLAAAAPDIHQQLDFCLRQIGTWSLDRIVLHFLEETKALASYKLALGEDEGRLVEANLLQLVELLGTETPRGSGSILDYRDLLQDYRGVDEMGNAVLAADSVHLMTMHKAKGLEFPLVILLGAEEALVNKRKSSRGSFLKTITGPRPFIYKGRNQKYRVPEIGEYRELKDLNLEEEKRESMRLLYVALTRARHYFVASSKQNTGTDVYFHILRTCLFNDLGAGPEDIMPGVRGWQKSRPPVAEMPVHLAAVEEVKPAPPEPAPDFSPIPLRGIRMVRPSEELFRYDFPGLSESADAGPRPDARASIKELEQSRLVGILIHRGLEAKISHKPWQLSAALRAVLQESLSAFTPAEYRQIQATVERHLAAAWNTPKLQALLDGAANIQAEVPVLHLEGTKLVTGIVDLLVRKDGDIWVVDYKSAPVDGGRPEEQVRSHGYHKQLRHYGNAVARIFGAAQVHLWVLFTETGEVVEIDR